MATNEITVKVNVEPSEELKQLIRQLIRQELADVAKGLKMQIGVSNAPIKDAAKVYTDIAEGKQMEVSKSYE